MGPYIFSVHWCSLAWSLVSILTQHHSTLTPYSQPPTNDLSNDRTTSPTGRAGPRQFHSIQRARQQTTTLPCRKSNFASGVNYICRREQKFWVDRGGDEASGRDAGMGEVPSTRGAAVARSRNNQLPVVVVVASCRFFSPHISPWGRPSLAWPNGDYSHFRLGSVVVRASDLWSRDIASSTPGRCIAGQPRSTQPSIPPG